MSMAEFSYCFPESPLRKLTFSKKFIVSSVYFGEKCRVSATTALIQRLLKLFSIPVLKEEEQRASNQCKRSFPAQNGQEVELFKRTCCAVIYQYVQISWSLMIYVSQLHWECLSLLCIPHRVWLSGISTEEAACFVHGGEEGPSRLNTRSAEGVPWAAWKLNGVQNQWESCPHYQYVHLGPLMGCAHTFQIAPRKYHLHLKMDFFLLGLSQLGTPTHLGQGRVLSVVGALLSLLLWVLSLCYVK